MSENQFAYNIMFEVFKEIISTIYFHWAFVISVFKKIRETLLLNATILNLKIFISNNNLHTYYILISV